jgi:hypothetical protein
MEGPQTRLQKFIDDLGLRALDIVREADRIASEGGVESISRKHFHQLRHGRVSATAERIYIVVAAIRSVTGMLVKATDLFVLQPAPSPSVAVPRTICAAESGRSRCCRSTTRSPIRPPRRMPSAGCST